MLSCTYVNAILKEKININKISADICAVLNF